jgi:hypothetical protein
VSGTIFNNRGLIVILLIVLLNFRDFIIGINLPRTRWISFFVKSWIYCSDFLTHQFMCLIEWFIAILNSIYIFIIGLRINWWLRYYILLKSLMNFSWFSVVWVKWSCYVESFPYILLTLCPNVKVCNFFCLFLIGKKMSFLNNNWLHVRKFIFLITFFLNC